MSWVNGLWSLGGGIVGGLGGALLGYQGTKKTIAQKAHTDQRTYEQAEREEWGRNFRTAWQALASGHDEQERHLGKIMLDALLRNPPPGKLHDEVTVLVAGVIGVPSEQISKRAKEQDDG